MDFYVRSSNPSGDHRKTAFLVEDNWDDWFKYNTLYRLIYFDENGKSFDIGDLKIGQINMTEGQRRPRIKETFTSLSDEFFSVGQDDSYYEKLNLLTPETKDKILIALRDMAFNPEILEIAKSEEVTQSSLLRYVTISSVSGQFHRISKGGARLSDYNFEFRKRLNKIDFRVKPDSFPPSNVQVIIGRNGSGKTNLLNEMTARAIAENNDVDSDEGWFYSHSYTPPQKGVPFSRVVFISFSAFDTASNIENSVGDFEKIGYCYVGLKKNNTDGSLMQKTPEQLADEFEKSRKICLKGAKKTRLMNALENLKIDPVFNNIEIEETLINERKSGRDYYLSLSSGHKVVILSIMRMVELVEERTLVVMDEPEAHLHPPLLSAFVRSLSDLLINRNGVAIIATHSPVILQEVPSNCVWKIRREGEIISFERPGIETFGENVGVLTREVFGLEVTKSGFHSLIEKLVDGNLSYEEIIKKLNGNIGGEARALVMALIHNKKGEK